MCPHYLFFVFLPIHSSLRLFFFFFLMIRPPPNSPLFPSTPLFRSMKPDPAGEEPVAERVLDQITATTAGRHDGPRHDLAPDVHVGRRVADDRRLALGARGGEIGRAHV